MALSKKERDGLPADDFAVPGKRALPMHDEHHVRMAWDMVARTQGLSADERKEARRRIIARAKQLGVDTADWEKGKLSARMSLNAMALDIATDDHPNKMPFSGILTRIDEPSDAPPEGSHGRLITISREAAEGALKSLLGMAVGYRPGFDGHAPQSKIGIITEARIEGNEVPIAGFIYAADFPEAAAEIKANKNLLGFSYEARNLFTDDPDADPCVITECVFTGAAILFKDKAAYRSTSIAAAADEGETTMDKELKDYLDKMAADQKTLATSVTTLTTNVTTLSASVEDIKTKGPAALAAANLMPKVETHAKNLETLAASMESDGIGADAQNGHAQHLRRMAGQLRAEAAQGRLPATFHGMYAAAAALVPHEIDPAVLKSAIETAVKPLVDANAALGTQIADLKAAAVKGSPAPERKTLPPAITALLAKAGVEMPTAAGDKIPMAKLDEALKGLGMSQRIEFKSGLAKAGLID
jgi:uncharacterized protein DUF6582